MKNLIIAGIVLSVSSVAFAGSSIRVNSGASTASSSGSSVLSGAGGSFQVSGAGASNKSTATLTNVGGVDKTVKATTETYGLTGSYSVGSKTGDGAGGSSAWSDQSGSATVTEHRRGY